MTGLSMRSKLTIVILVALLILACGFVYFHSENKKIGVLRVDAGPRNGEAFFFMTQLAEVVERNSQLIRLEVVEGIRGPVDAPVLFRDGIDLATIQSHRPAQPETHLVVGLYEEAFQLITRVDTGINTVNDLHGRRLALPPHGSSELTFFWAVGDHYDLLVQNVEWASMPPQDAVVALLDKQVDAIFLVGSARNQMTLKLVEEFELHPKVADLRMIAIDQAPAMGIKRPYIEPTHIEKGTFDGMPPLPGRRLLTAAVRRFLVASAGANADHVAELTRILFENRADLSVRFPLANRIRVPDLASGMTIPLHEGAERYFTRDEPSFIQENAEPLALLVTVFMMLSSMLIALRSRFLATQKNLADQFNYDVLDLGKKVRAANRIEEIEQCREDMQTLLDKAVVALDVDDVTDEGFQSFAFLWNSVQRDLNERRGSLLVTKKTAKPQAAE